METEERDQPMRTAIAGGLDGETVDVARMGSTGMVGFQITLPYHVLRWSETTRVELRLHANPAGFIEAEWVNR